MKGARSVALAATGGNLLQGWDSAAIAGALLFLRSEFNFDENPTLEGLLVAATLIGAVTSTTVAGPAADAYGRRFMLVVSGLLFASSASIMLWSPTIYVLIIGRIVVGLSIGLAATITPILISESAPSEIRGQLGALPQLMGTSGMFVAYFMVFYLSLSPNPSWRLILGVMLAPALVFLALGIFYLPESPRWLVSKGRMQEAKAVLQNLRGQEDVSGELALLVEGLGVGVDTSIEEWLVKPAEVSDVLDPVHADEGHIPLFGPGGPDEDLAWIAEPIKEDGTGTPQLLRQRSNDSHGISLVDNVVQMMSSIHHVHDGVDGIDDNFSKTSHAGDEESGIDANGYLSAGYVSEEQEDGGIVGDFEEGGLSSPLLRKSTASKTNLLPRKNSSSLSLRSFRGLSRSSSRTGTVEGLFGETVGSYGIGGGWQLAWRTDGEDGRYERVFLHEGVDTSRFASAPSRFASHASLPNVGNATGADGEAFPAVALVAPSVQFGKDMVLDASAGPATVHPSEIASKGPAWAELTEPGVKRALVVGIGIQFLQQLCGLNAVLFFTPQILKQSGVDTMAESVGLNGDSASILASAATGAMMLPCIIVAMWLMDRAGRRQLLLSTIPVLGLGLGGVIVTSTLIPAGTIQGIGSFLGVSVFLCAFVMGFGPIPNILCSEIFPTRVRGIAIGLTSGTMWVANVIVTYSFPLANAVFGIVAVFGFFIVMSIFAWIFVFLRVPETKGLPLEIICEFFAMAGHSNEGKKHASADADEKEPLIKSV